jgi:branched-chain amino acid transport system ATP-binding protein
LEKDMSSSPLLSTADLYAQYGDARVLNGISIKVDPGEVVTILGANGAGKTTLLKVISGLLKPIRGRVVFRGEDIGAKPAHQIRQMGLIHVPEGRGVLGNLTVKENLVLGSYGAPKKEQAARIEEIYEQFPILKERGKQLGGLLSGGEQTILAIARGLVGKPHCILIDEPSLGIAPVMVDRIFDILRDMKKARLPVLLVEQNASQALEISDRSYVMEVGRMVAEGDMEKILSNKRIVEAYLGL